MPVQLKAPTRNIYAYCNIQTQQVIYSLQPSLHNASVRRQLPDTGANTSFVKLRKDLWHPLWTLAIPESDYADAQGLHTFKKLREWRKLHEVSWEPPADLARPYTKREIEAMEKKLEDRGGSKKENVYDIIRREKRKMRINTVLNQRANSVADLAAVLVEQEAMGLETADQNEAGAAAKLDAERGNMLKLAAEADAGGLEKLDTRIAALEDLKAKADRLGEVGTSRTRISKQLHDANIKRMKMQTSVDAVARAKEMLAQPHLDRLASLKARIKVAEERIQAYEELPDLARLASESAEVGGSQAQLQVRADELKKLLKKKGTTNTQEVDSELETLCTRQKELRKARRTLETIAKIEKGALNDVQDEIQEIEVLESEIKDANGREAGDLLRREAWRTAGYDSDRGDTLRLQRAELEAVEQEYALMSNASVELAEAKAELKTAEAETATEVTASSGSAASASEEAARPAKPATDEAQIRELLPGFPAPKSDSPNLPKRGRLRTMIDRQKRPVFSTEGITVKWSNVLDAELAEQWPGNVEHAPMGIVRHTAPPADKAAVLDMATRSARIVERATEKKEKGRAGREREEKVKLVVLEKVREAMEARRLKMEAREMRRTGPMNVPAPAMKENMASM
ncbi:hypothetical protein B0A48_00239 [Cryoendolithus antarcticus]|uniref:Large ribosomal subunit protein mL67 n=1 Tax=Cryoendolithus antarcticus TaxID=1507870 RepID=A0A1V8TU47_9PEZI|nr:hypothetical protein B0A48_00239 [Cryoendolithus antarcticus]